MDLSGLNLESVRTRGRAAKPVTVSRGEDLRPADLALLAAERGSKAPSIKKLRDRHHALARCLADGLSEGEAAIATGYDRSRVSILKDDPSFKELVAFYRSEVQERYLGLHEAMSQLGLDSVRELQDRMEDAPEEFSPKELLAMAQFAADRTGHGPSSKQEVNHTVNFGARLEAARARMVDITPERLALESDDE